jgi:hypothetical protein
LPVISVSIGKERKRSLYYAADIQNSRNKHVGVHDSKIIKPHCSIFWLA